MNEFEEYLKEMEISDFENELIIASKGSHDCQLYFFYCIYNFAKRRTEKKCFKELRQKLKIANLSLWAIVLIDLIAFVAKRFF